jgi:small-conductance mechanosensitive channel
MHGFLARNSPDDLLVAAIVALVVLVVSIGLRRYVLGRLAALASKTDTMVDDLIVHFVQSIRGWGWCAISIVAGLSTLRLSTVQERTLHTGFVLVFALQLGLSLQSVIGAAVDKRREREGRPGAATTLAAVNAIGRVLVWSAVILLGLSNLGVQVSALAATLGVGGLAAAFAVQNVLGDLFASLSIYLDRPFDIGDAIQVDTLSGVVESISWRSTRVRSVSGEQLVFGNGDLTRSRIQNFRRLSERRVVLRFRLPLDAPLATLESMSQHVRELVEAQKDVRFERAHLVEVGESALVFETVFWCTTSDYEKMLDRKQAVILGLRRILDAQDVPFAIPRTMVERPETDHSRAERS